MVPVRQPAGFHTGAGRSPDKAIFDQQDPVARMTDYLAFLKTLKDNDSRNAAVGALLENFNPRERGREGTCLLRNGGLRILRWPWRP